MRVSKADSSQSPTFQRDALLAAAVDADQVHNDHAPGRRDHRPGLVACLKALRQGDTLVVWKLDRLGRNLHHLANTVDELSARCVGLKGLRGQGAAIDTTTPAGKLVFAIFAALAECEREFISERTVVGVASARAHGCKRGRPYKMTPPKLRLATASMSKPDTNVEQLCSEVQIEQANAVPARLQDRRATTRRDQATR